MYLLSWGKGTNKYDFLKMFCQLLPIFLLYNKKDVPLSPEKWIRYG